VFLQPLLVLRKKDHRWDVPDLTLLKFTMKNLIDWSDRQLCFSKHS